MLPKHYFTTVVFEPEPKPRKNKFEVYGVVTTKAFQLSKRYVEKLHAIFPREYDVPYVNPMLDLDWSLFLTKIRREIGGEKLWSLKKPVIVFKNSDILGNDDDLLRYVAVRYKLSLHYDYEELGVQQLIQYVQQQKDNGNVFVYFTISVDKFVIGSMLFEIYAKTVPVLSKLFLKLCVKEQEGYAGKPIQRIVRPSWIQCGGWHLSHHNVACENYIIPHNKRGVLSMCNNGKHKDNHTQFMISLEPTPWMDYKYVAFGQLIFGEPILRQIESVPTHYEEPLKQITIAQCGLYDLHSTFDQQHLDVIEKYLSRKDETTNMHQDVIDVRDAPSILLRDKYLKKYYSAPSDKTSYLPLQQLPPEDAKSEEIDLTADGISSLKSGSNFCKFKETNQVRRHQ